MQCYITQYWNEFYVWRWIQNSIIKRTLKRFHRTTKEQLIGEDSFAVKAMYLNALFYNESQNIFFCFLSWSQIGDISLLIRIVKDPFFAFFPKK